MKILSSNWLTTFGDVLTLLLCFVIVAISNPEHRENHNYQSNQIDSPKAIDFKMSVDAFGKPIASKKVSESRQQEFIFTAEDFEQTVQSLSFQGLAKVKELEGRTTEKIELKICNFDQKNVESLYVAISGKAKTVNLTSGAQSCRQLAARTKNSKEQIVLLTAWFS